MMLTTARFFPRGHFPSCCRGLSSCWWAKLVVTAAGEVVLASQEENGNVLGCHGCWIGVLWCFDTFGVGRYQPEIAPTKSPFDVREEYETTLECLLDAAEATATEGTDVIFATFDAEKYDPGRRSGAIKDTSTLFIAASVVACTVLEHFHRRLLSGS
jgi:hypothetical protein